MSKSLRLSEQMYRYGLWALSLVFALCLIGLGSAVLSDLPQVERTLTVEEFYAPGVLAQFAAQQQEQETQKRQWRAEEERLQLAYTGLQKSYERSKETHMNWLSTRTVTGAAQGDSELEQRMQRLEGEQNAVLAAEQALAEQQHLLAELDSQAHALAEAHGHERRAAYAALHTAQQRSALRVFLYRLLVTLPLLVVALWLFKHKRSSQGWPFARGFIIFALFAFFVELVPYLPSYGGYVRYGVGLLLTVLVGRQAIRALNQYLQRQREKEAQPEALRRERMDYEVAFQRLAKGACPGCERGVAVNDPTVDFCQHCGLNLFDYCHHCEARKNSLASYCYACGEKCTKGEG